MEYAVAGVSKLAPDALVAKSLYVEGMLTTNASTFRTPNPTVAELTAARTHLQTAITNAMNGGREFTRLKLEAAKALRTLLTGEAKYVSAVAQGNADIIGLSGFTVNKKPSPYGLLVAPDGMSVRMNGKQGELALRCKARRGAKSYNVYMTTGNPNDPAAEWDLVGNTTKARFTMTQLTPGKFYAFCMSALGTAGESGLSEPVISVAA